MNIVLLLTSALFAAAAVLPFRTFDVRWCWLLSVLITEYGQWLVILAGAGVLLSFARPRGPTWISTLGFTAALIVFAMPTITMIARIGGWQRQLRRSFGGTLAESKFAEPDLLRLWFGPLLSTSIEPREVIYVRRGTQDLKLDVYPARADHPAPFLIMIHGGGWNSGTPKDLAGLNSYLAVRGVTVLSPQYRLAPGAPWPAARDDVREAIRYAKAHATDLNIDPKRFVIMGRSAGGQLAQIVAFTARDPDLRACVSLYAPTDMFKAYEWGREDDILGSRPLVREYMGGAPEDLKIAYAEASPLAFVDHRAPPTLLIHGARDPLVWIKHSERLRDRLTEARVPNALLELPWGTHGFDYNVWGPGGQTLAIALEYLLRRVF